MQNPSKPQPVGADLDEIQARLLDLFFGQSVWSVGGSGVAAGLLLAILWPHAPSGALLGWAGTVLLSLVLRGGSIAYRRCGGREAWPPPAWHRWALCTAALSGLAWGSLALVYPQIDSPPHRTLLLLAVMGVAAGSATLLVGLGGAVQAFGIPALLPVVAMLLQQGGSVHRWLALALLLYLLCGTVLLPRRVQRYLREMHATGVEHEGLLLRLEAAERMAHVGHFEWNARTGAVRASAELRRMLVLGADRPCRGEDLWRCVVPVERQRLRARVRSALRRCEKEFAYEAALCLPNGVTDVSVVHHVQYGADGRALRGLTTVQDISARKADQRELQALAFHDPLTGLVNRKRFQDRLAALVDRATDQRPLALLMLDLDHFKSVNDTLGHAAGDRLLVAVSQRVLACAREVDIVARLGGDEFAIIAPDLSSGIAAAELAAAVNQALARPFLLDQQEIYVSSSIGIALYPEDAQGADMLLRCADMALFDAKAKGRSNFQFHLPEQSEQARARVALEADLRKALERRELALHFQPKVDMRDARLVGAEALLRWHQRDRGPVPPDDFIRIAEDSGLIVPIGEWVLREACHAARAWNDGRAPDEALKIAVNLSPRQFWAPNLLNMVCDVLVETGCKAEWIELEITESLLLDSRGQVGEVLAGLREMGFTMAIDDFGTGYSALGYLTRFPISTLKIDRSFVNEVAVDPEREAIVRAIVSMGESLHLTLVAEGVETTAQAKVLQRLGCHQAQGWLYGRAIARGAFEQLHLGSRQVVPVF